MNMFRRLVYIINEMPPLVIPKLDTKEEVRNDKAKITPHEIWTELLAIDAIVQR